jgi:hypothetical protein
MYSPFKSKLNHGQLLLSMAMPWWQHLFSSNHHSYVWFSSICMKELNKTTKIPDRVHAGWDVVLHRLYETVTVSSPSYASYWKHQGWRNGILPLARHPYTILTVNKPTLPFILHLCNVLHNIERESLKAHSRHARSIGQQRGSRQGFPKLKVATHPSVTRDVWRTLNYRYNQVALMA